MFLHDKKEKVLMDGEMNMKNDKKTAKKSAVKTPAKRANSLSGSQWLKNSFSIWRNLGKNTEEKKIEHPAMFTNELVSKLLETYTTCNGEKVLDPFAGSGTTLLSSMEKNMSPIGIDINEKFKKIFTDRVSLLASNAKWEYHIDDAKNLSNVIEPESIDICITSPPYWNILNRKRTAAGGAPTPYSDLKNDIGNTESYEEFLSSLGQISKLIYDTLKPKSFFIINVMDLRQKSKFYPLHMDAISEITKCSFTLDDIIIWDRQDSYNNMRPLGYPYKFIINRVHEYVLIFRK